MRTKTIEVYTFNELSDKAKEAAREWYRGQHALDHDWYDFVYEDAVTCGGLIGIEFDHKPGKTMSGKPLNDPAIYFHGFGSQGDGACFEGHYSFAEGAVADITKHAPQETTLHEIAARLQEVQQRYGNTVTASVKHRGHYYHSHCTEIDVDADTQGVTHKDACEVQLCLRVFMDWIYKNLERERDYQLSDEVVDEMLTANAYEFEESGVLS